MSQGETKKPDDRNLFGDAHAALSERFQGPDGMRLVGAYNPIGQPEEAITSSTSLSRSPSSWLLANIRL